MNLVLDVCYHFFQMFLGVIYENENDANGMQRILEHLQKYVPYYLNENIQKRYYEQGIVGDQLTVERGVIGLLEVSNGFTPEERHEGVHFEIVDFHGGMKLMEVILIFKVISFLKCIPNLIRL